MTLFKDFDMRFPVIFLMTCCVFFLLYCTKNAVAGLGVYLFCPALLLIVPSLFLNLRDLLIVVIFFGFLFEVALPVNTGFLPLAFAVFSFLIYRSRRKFRNLDPLGIISLTVLLNLALYLFCVFFLFPKGIENSLAYWLRVLVDGLLSLIYAAILSLVVLNFCRSIFYLMGENLNIKED